MLGGLTNIIMRKENKERNSIFSRIKENFKENKSFLSVLVASDNIDDDIEKLSELPSIEEIEISVKEELEKKKQIRQTTKIKTQTIACENIVDNKPRTRTRTTKKTMNNIKDDEIDLG